MIARKVLYWGQVQGVGFRYTTRSLAKGFAVAGFVRNLADGRVELVAEGEAAEVERFLDAVRRRLAENIEGHQVDDVAPLNFRDFEIRR